VLRGVQLHQMLKLGVSYLLFSIYFHLCCCDCSFFVILKIVISFLTVFIFLLIVQGNSIRAAESALILENHRLKKLEELETTNQSLKSRSNEVSTSFYRFICLSNQHLLTSHVAYLLLVEL